MRKLVVLSVLLSACGFSDDELGLIASAVLHSVEQARADVEGLDLAYFGLSGLVNPTADGFEVFGSVANSCGGSAGVSGGGKRSAGKLQYLIELELAGWASCQGEVEVSGQVQARVSADDVTVSEFRQRPATSHATGEVRARGNGIASDNHDVPVSFDLTMATRPGSPEPEVFGSIDDEEL